MLSRNLELTLNRALYIAKKFCHEYATYEHLLLALLEDEDVQEFLQQTDIDTEQIGEDLVQYLSVELASFKTHEVDEALPTAGFQRIVHRSAVHGNSLSQTEVNGVNLLAEFFFEHEAYALSCLKEQNLTRPYVLNYIKEHYTDTYQVPEAHNTSPASDNNISEISAHPSFTSAPSVDNDNLKSKEQQHSANTDSAKEPALLKKFCTNLNARAEAKKIDHVVGRDKEMTRTIEILSRRHKNNPILVGEPGVGKTAIAEGLALLIHNKECPNWLIGATIYALDLPSVIAGTKYRGDFEERITNIIEIFRKHPDYILFIDEIHMLVGAGSTTSSGMDASNILKPALARGEIRCIGATTFHEYHMHFEKDSALTRRFQRIIVDEPSPDEALEILKGLKSYYEEYHQVSYDNKAIKAAIDLSEKYIHDKNLPDKAIELLDDAAARKKIISKSIKDVVITDADIRSTISAITHIPSIVSSDDDIRKLQSLDQTLKTHIFGQDHAIDSICKIIKMSRAGLRTLEKPVGSFLFAGTTGVGKTELAKKLAKIMGMKLLKFDMSEYADMQSISRLIGSSPGYVGYSQGGMLTESISRNPHAVLLLDEFEKAHPSVHNLLLQIIDEGRLTDNAGKVVDCRHTIIVLTSNLATPIIQQDIVGFIANSSDTSNLAHKEIQNILPNELHSRLDEIIIFNQLDEQIIDQIVAEELQELSIQLADKLVKISYTQKAKTFLRNQMLSNMDSGMRILKRCVDSEIRRKCAEEILFGSLKNGGKVKISVENNEISCFVL